ncbi:MAG TPA: DUF3788 family protein [Gemmatimonadales bacterium]|nr:DUF3788 family protein [Gemmatimonadales bacterium]
MSVGRSNAYWSGNHYRDPAVEPSPTAPVTDLPAAPAARFRALRSGLLALDGVGESVRYMGASWRWAWEYGIGNRKLCWIHVVSRTISTTFTLSDAEAERLAKLPRVAVEVARAVAEAQRTGPVRWCWLELADRRIVDGFLRVARYKAEWLGERPGAHRVPKLRGRGGSAGDGE